MKWLILILIPIQSLSGQQLFEIPGTVFSDWLPMYDALEIVEDPDHQFQFEEVSNSNLWRTNETSQSFDDQSVYWVRVKVSSQRNERYVLLLPSKMKWIDTYIQYEDSTIFQKAGVMAHPSQKEFIYIDRNFAVLDLSQYGEATMTFRMVPHSKYHPRGIKIFIQDLDHYQNYVDALEKKYLFFGGIFLVMMFFNFLFYLNMKERSYLLYGLFIFFITLSSGLRMESFKVVPAYIIFDFASEAMYYAATIFLMLFTIRHLDINKNEVFIYRMCRGLVSSMSGLTLVMLSDFLLFPDLKLIRSLTLRGLPYFLLIAASVFLITSCHYLLKKNRDIYYLGGISVLALSMILFASNFAFSFIPFQSGVTVVYSGISVQMALFSLSISSKMRKTQIEKAQAIHEKLDLQQNINKQLEEKVTERTAQLEHRNTENELLLGEIHHRVKNNLQIISSLLKLQSRQLEEGKAKSAVLEGRDRVKSMALIHQRLYQQDKFSSIEMHDYIKKLIDGLAESYGYQETYYQLKMDVPTLYLDVDTAIPLGLIINELVSNVFKHAFSKGHLNKLSIFMEKNETKLNLHIQDNGTGLPADLTSAEIGSFGIQLVEALVNELGGKVVYENNHGLTTKLQIDHASDPFR